MLTKTLSEAKKKQRNILIKAMNNDIGSIDSSKDSWNPAQISERAKDISYIRSLVDTWNPAQLNEALRMLDLPVIDTWNPAQIEEQRRNLVFYLAERTLTGNPITLNILGNLTPEVTGLKVTMNPIQDFHGYLNPWVGGAGKNKFSCVDSLNPSSNLSATKNADGSVRIYGTPNDAWAEVSDLADCALPAGQYTFSIQSSVAYNIYTNCYVGGTNTNRVITAGNTSVTFTVNGTIDNIRLMISGLTSGTAIDITIKPMLASGTDTVFAPYSNICPISGRTEASVKRTGKNQINESTITKLIRQGSETTSGITNENGIITVSRQYGASGQYALAQTIPITSGKVTISADLLLAGTDVTDKRARTVVLNPSATAAATSGSVQNVTFTQTNAWEHHSVTYELNENASDGFCVVLQPIYSGTTLQIKNLQVETGEIESSYEPYTAETHTHQYSETIYGGVDDFVNGGLSNEWGYIESYDGETLPGEWISDRDVYAPDTTPTAGAEVAYKLATPTTISTSAEEITLLKGENVLSTDGDSIELKYKQNF